LIRFQFLQFNRILTSTLCLTSSERANLRDASKGFGSCNHAVESLHVKGNCCLASLSSDLQATAAASCSKKASTRVNTAQRQINQRRHEEYLGSGEHFFQYIPPRSDFAFAPLGSGALLKRFFIPFCRNVHDLSARALGGASTVKGFARIFESPSEEKSLIQLKTRKDFNYHADASTCGRFSAASDKAIYAATPNNKSRSLGF
jgi:hypothetical protein